MKAVGIGRPETEPEAERIVYSIAEIHNADLIALMMNSNGEKP
jgi:hypothetical protein